MYKVDKTQHAFDVLQFDPLSSSTGIADNKTRGKIKTQLISEKVFTRIFLKLKTNFD